VNISSRFADASESPTLAITQRARELRAAGKQILSLSAGEPDFPTPAAIAEAGIAAIRSGKTRYTAAAGTQSLRDRVSEALARDFGLDYAPREICISASTKPGIFLSLCGILEDGDEVVVPAPYWVSYPEMVRLAGGQAVMLPCHERDGFLPDPERLEAALARPRVRGILWNSPNNPSGAVWPEPRVAELVGMCRRLDRWILADEIYSKIVYDGRHVSPGAVAGGKDVTVVLGGLSKSYSMTGWRLGWIAGPEHLVGPTIRVQGQLFGNACSISQAAAEVALGDEGSAACREMVAAFAARRDYLLAAIPKVRGLTLYPPDGAFYLFPGCQEILDGLGIDDEQLAVRLLDEAEIAVVPGTAFGAPGHIRLSFAASMETLEQAVARLSEWIDRNLPQ